MATININPFAYTDPAKREEIIARHYPEGCPKKKDLTPYTPYFPSTSREYLFKGTPNETEANAIIKQASKDPCILNIDAKGNNTDPACIALIFETLTKISIMHSQNAYLLMQKIMTPGETRLTDDQYRLAKRSASAIIDAKKSFHYTLNLRQGICLDQKAFNSIEAQSISILKKDSILPSDARPEIVMPQSRNIIICKASI